MQTNLEFDEILILTIIFNHNEKVNSLQITDKMFKSLINKKILNLFIKLYKENRRIEIGEIFSNLNNQNEINYVSINIITNDNYDEVSRFFETMRSKGEWGRKQLGKFRISVFRHNTKANNRLAEITFNEYTLKLNRIDGNHRLSASDNVEGDFSVPFCLVLTPNDLDQKVFSTAIFHNINAKQIPLNLEDNLKVIDKAIEKNVKGLCDNEFTILKSIPGIGDVYAAGIISEIGSIEFFKHNNALAKYAGLTWRKTQSGYFEAETTRLTKTGNKYLRYYLIEAVSSVKNHSREFNEFYTRKYNEVNRGAHKRALALSARKLVRLIFGLLHHNQLYSAIRLDNRSN